MSGDAFPAAWRPEPGQAITGVIVRLDVGQGGYGPYPIVTLRGASGRELAVAFARAAPAYHGYRVEGAERPFDWTQFGGPILGAPPTPGPVVPVPPGPAQPASAAGMVGEEISPRPTASEAHETPAAPPIDDDELGDIPF